MFHKQISKANFWIKNSLLCKIHQDFDTFMKTNKTFVTRESLLYQKILDENERIKEQFCTTKRDFVDPTMRAALYKKEKVFLDKMG